MCELPDELWNLIKQFLLHYKKYHQLKMKPIVDKIILKQKQDEVKIKELLKKLNIKY